MYLEAQAPAALGTKLRATFPAVTDRLRLGLSGKSVSPLCFGLVPEPEIVIEGFDAGVNFFFVTADLHWPLYSGVRKGLAQLLERAGGIRNDIVVGVVSYLDQPLFHYLQFNEVLDAIPGLGHVDLLIAGAVHDPDDFNARYASISQARSVGRWGSCAIGASFHDRRTALASLNTNCLDMHYIRYNAGHPNARRDIFPFLRSDRNSLTFNFTSVLPMVGEEQVRSLGTKYWAPKPTDYYRYVLSSAEIDGLLCAPRSVDQFKGLLDALADRTLTPAEINYMTQLSTSLTPRYF